MIKAKLLYELSIPSWTLSLTQTICHQLLVTFPNESMSHQYLNVGSMSLQLCIRSVAASLVQGNVHIFNEFWSANIHLGDPMINILLICCRKTGRLLHISIWDLIARNVWISNLLLFHFYHRHYGKSMHGNYMNWFSIVITCTIPFTLLFSLSLSSDSYAFIWKLESIVKPIKNSRTYNFQLNNSRIDSHSTWLGFNFGCCLMLAGLFVRREWLLCQTKERERERAQFSLCGFVRLAPSIITKLTIDTKLAGIRVSITSNLFYCIWSCTCDFELSCISLPHTHSHYIHVWPVPQSRYYCLIHWLKT